MPTPITHREIRERAYDIWERNHRPQGCEIECWVMAERELKAERIAETHPPERPLKLASVADRPPVATPAQSLALPREQPAQSRGRTAA